MTTLELRLYEALKRLRDRFHMCAEAGGSDMKYVRLATRDADALIRECEAQLKREAEEVRSE